MFIRVNSFVVAMTLGAALLALLFPAVSANDSSSSSYRVTEVEFGSGQQSETCSGTYCAQASIGSLDASQVNNSRHTAEFGELTNETEPLLEIIVEPGASDLGLLSTDKTASKQTAIKIRSYQSSGYRLQVNGHPPKHSGHTLKALDSPTASTKGVEQFGINVVANTTPAIGADPVQVPSAGFSFGAPTTDYSQANLFKYRSGDEIAGSISQSGQTDYTVSMIINISDRTPAGHFVTDFSAVVIAAF